MEYSFNEIAKILGIPSSEVSKAYHSGMEKISAMGYRFEEYMWE